MDSEAFIMRINNNPYALYIGAEFDGKLIAYCGIWIILDESHITNIAVLPEFRGMKIGDKLMYQMMSSNDINGAKKATLEVRVSNILLKICTGNLDFKMVVLEKVIIQIIMKML